MKYFLTFVCISVFIAVVQCQTSKEFLQTIRECKTKTSCTEDVVKILKNNQMPKTPECNCAVACVMKKVGAMEADNSVNAETTKTILGKMHIKENKAQTIADTCKTQVGTITDECEAGKMFAKCVMDNKSK